MPGLRLPDLCCGVIEPQQNVTVAEQAREARFFRKAALLEAVEEENRGLSNRCADRSAGRAPR